MFSRDKDWAQVVKTNYFPLSLFYSGVTSREKRVSTQAKPISEVVKDFEQSLENLRPSTKRVYVAGARAAIRAAGLEFWQCPSPTDLLVSIEKFPIEKGVRISPFLDFLGGAGPKNSLSEQDSLALQNWVIQRLAKQMRSGKNPSIATRRDTALIAALCVAPAQGTPRKWPENCLKVEDHKVLLWDAAIEEPSFALSLHFWHAWSGQTTGGSTANLSGGANQDSFSPGPTALPWAEQPCTTLCGDSTWPVSAAASDPSLRKKSEPLSSVEILFRGRPPTWSSPTGLFYIPRRRCWPIRLVRLASTSPYC
jgi:hypothetical protein